MLEGSMTAMITPFKKTGSVNWDELKNLVEHQINGKTSVLVPCGTTGESPTLSPSEHDKVIENVVKYAKGRVKVMAGTGSNSTSEAIEHTKNAKKAGADYALVVAPYYNKPTQEGIYKHYAKIAENGGLPIVIYNIPGRTGINIDPATIAKLVKDYPQFIGVKEATGSALNASRIIDEIEKKGKGKKFSVLSGDDALTLPLMALGGRGVVSVIGNLFPAMMSGLVQHALEGDFERARSTHKKHFQLMTTMFVETNPVPIKYAMYLAGHIANPEVRLPLSELTKKSQKQVQTILARHGIK